MYLEKKKKKEEHNIIKTKSIPIPKKRRKLPQSFYIRMDDMTSDDGESTEEGSEEGSEEE